MPTYNIVVDGKSYKIELFKVGENSFSAKINEKPCKVELVSNQLSHKKILVKLGNKQYKVELGALVRDALFSVKVNDIPFQTELKTFARRLVSPTTSVSTLTQPRRPLQKPVKEGAVTAPMTGKIVSVKVKKGEAVKMGHVLCVLEAMKMENEITAPKAGIIEEIYVSEGTPVNEGDTLLVIRVERRDNDKG